MRQYVRPSFPLPILAPPLGQDEKIIYPSLRIRCRGYGGPTVEALNIELKDVSVERYELPMFWRGMRKSFMTDRHAGMRLRGVYASGHVAPIISLNNPSLWRFGNRIEVDVGGFKPLDQPIGFFGVWIQWDWVEEAAFRWSSYG
jgi:hypothetical protein